MAYSTGFRNAAVNAVGQNGGADYFSLHTADPGTTGASEVTGGSYARVSAGFPAASAGSSTNAGATINVPAGTTVTHLVRGRRSAQWRRDVRLGRHLHAHEHHHSACILIAGRT